MNANLEKIEWLFEEGFSGGKISDWSGIARMTISDIASGKTAIEKMSFLNAAKLTELAEVLEAAGSKFDILFKICDGNLKKVKALSKYADRYSLKELEHLYAERFITVYDEKDFKESIMDSVMGDAAAYEEALKEDNTPVVDGFYIVECR